MVKVGIIAAGLLALNGCSDGCANSLIYRVDAPDKLHSAVMFQRDCGATTGFSTQISVLKTGEESSDGGNTFIADGGATTGDWGGPWAAIMWTGNNALLIRYAAGSRTFKQRQQVSGVRIRYQVIDR